MENPSSSPQNAFHKRRPFQIGIGLFLCAILIVGIVIGIWLITKPNSSGCGSWSNSTTNSPTTSSTPPTSTQNGSTSSTTTRPMPPQRNVKVHLNLFNTSILHVWLKAKERGKEAVLYANFSSSASPNPLFSTKETDWFEFFQMESGGRTEIVEFSWSNSITILSYMYVYEPENVKTQGIRPAYICEQAKGPNVPQSFHLRPPLGWQNDPNGFSRAADHVYHLFYQHYPHSTARGPMHWGHATSTDLVNWAHQPIFLRTEDKKCGDKCGWFSGSAVPNPNGAHGLRIFLTNHNETRAISEVQSSMPTFDTILPSTNPVVIIGEEPKNPRPDLKLTADFRDPNVFLGPHGYFYMTLGSKDTLGKGGVILLYQTKYKKLDSEWIFQNVILTDNTFGTEVCECSGIVPLGDPFSNYTYYALLYARMTSIDEDGKRNLSPIILGTFDGTTFNKISEQELDFAAGSYGFQAFYDPIDHETLLIGWLANWPDWDQHSEFPSTMTLPRVLKQSGNNTILQGPHPNVVRQLRGMELDGKALLRGNTVMLPNGTAYIRLGINYKYFGNGIFIRLSHPEYLQLGVRVTYIGMEIVKVQRGDAPNRSYMASNAQPDIVHIFIDRDSLEVFGEKKDDGGMPRWAGTTRLTGNGKFFVDSVQLETTNLYYVIDNCQIWQMKSAKLKGHVWG